MDVGEEANSQQWYCRAAYCFSPRIRRAYLCDPYLKHGLLLTFAMPAVSSSFIWLPGSAYIVLAASNSFAFGSIKGVEVGIEETSVPGGNNLGVL